MAPSERCEHGDPKQESQSQPSCLPRRARFFRTSGRLRPTSGPDTEAVCSGQVHLPRVTGRLHPTRQITVRAAAPPHPRAPTRPPARSPRGACGWARPGAGGGAVGVGSGEKAGPSGNSRPRLPQPRAPADAGASAPREQAAVLPRQRQGTGAGGRSWKAFRGRGRGPGGGGARRERPASGSLLPRNSPPATPQSMGFPPPPPRSPVRAHQPTHNSLISTIFPEPPHSCRRYHRRRRRRYRPSRRLRGPASLPPPPTNHRGACAFTPFRRDSSRQRARGAGSSPAPRPTLGWRGLH